jgi:hypothetical protein
MENQSESKNEGLNKNQNIERYQNLTTKFEKNKIIGRKNEV